MKRSIWLTTSAVALLLSIIGPSHVAAGGWAITSLDPFDQPVAGQATAIGFTILQHGVTPVDIADVGIRLSEQGKPGQFFPAVPDGQGRVGHYTAHVVFPTVGTFSWIVEQGMFGPQDLGLITITNAAPTQAAGDAVQHPATLRYGLPLIAALCLVIIVGHSTRERRRPAIR
ncbi:MAG: hypothetical protein M3P52_10345 [Actinomycetota bacterium]|nr:hypothetical protein [Actinomycetota bacterium]